MQVVLRATLVVLHRDCVRTNYFWSSYFLAVIRIICNVEASTWMTQWICVLLTQLSFTLLSVVLSKQQQKTLLALQQIEMKKLTGCFVHVVMTALRLYQRIYRVGKNKRDCWRRLKMEQVPGIHLPAVQRPQAHCHGHQGVVWGQ